VKCRLAGSAASLDQLPRVIALPTADYDDRFGVGDQLPQRELSILCRTANRIDESHLGIRMKQADKIDNIPDEIDRLGRLRNDPVTSALRKFRNIITGTYDNGFREISDQSFYFDVAGFADDNGKESGGDELLELFVGVAHERTRSIRNVKSGRAPLRALLIGRAVRRDHNTRRPRSCLIERRLADVLCAQPLADDRIVHEFAQDRERTQACELFGLGNGVAHAEAHSEMFSYNDSHSLRILTL
jgi:hypothetical protein